MSVDSRTGCVDRTEFLAEAHRMTQARLDVPPLAETLERTEYLARGLRALKDELAEAECEAACVVLRSAVRLLAEPPDETASPFTAWQYLLNLSRTGQALLDITGRAQ